jgi:hypothetical protein
VPPEFLLLAVIGAGTTVFGTYTISHRAFPAWVTGPLLWPLARVTPSVAITTGCAAVVAGATSLVYPFAAFAPEAVRPALTVLSIGVAILSLFLVGYATWLSRRSAEQRP